MGEEFGGQTSRTQQRHQGERACARLLGLIAGITADGHLHDLEIQFLRTWLAENTQAADHWLGAQLAAQIDHIMADGQVSDAERSDLLQPLQAAGGTQFAETGAVTPEAISGFPADVCDVVFQGNTFCLTGKFHFGSRADCQAATVAAGGQCVDSVNRNTRYLVIGSAGATQSWKQATYGQKIDSAMKLREKGHPIAVLTEDAWRAALPAAATA